jgi:hypothetical protein
MLGANKEQIMGQQANSGRRASLDDKKRRAAGRGQRTEEVEAVRDTVQGPEYAKGKTAGAFGKNDRANRKSPLTATDRIAATVGTARRRSK